MENSGSHLNTKIKNVEGGSSIKSTQETYTGVARTSGAELEKPEFLLTSLKTKERRKSAAPYPPLAAPSL